MPASHEVYRVLVEARALEEAIAAAQPFYHSGFGMEAVGVGVASALGPADGLVPHYRGVGAPLAKGMSSFDILTSYLLKATSPVGGRVWHPVDPSLGLYGHQGTSGSEFGRGAGLALAAKHQGGGRVAAAIFGDGSAHRGTLHEAFLTARAWELPVLWVCENNGWMISTPAARIWPGDVSDLARGYDMPTEIVDGNDVFAVREAVDGLLDTVRAASRPAFLECKTYRVRSHFEGEGHDYQDPDEIEAWRQRDPLLVARRRLEAEGAPVDVIDGLEAEARATVADAMERASREPDLPPDHDAFAGLYAGSR